MGPPPPPIGLANILQVEKLDKAYRRSSKLYNNNPEKPHWVFIQIVGTFCISKAPQ